jgi:Flp pilus assembly protein TadD
MVVAQVYDNLAGRGMPPKADDTSAAAALGVPTPDASVTQLANLQSCVASDPNNLQCVTGLADMYYQAQQWDQAQTNYQQAVKLSPHDAALLLKLAGTEIYQDEFEQAIPTLQQAATIRPDAPEIHLLLGLALQKTSPPQTAAAVEEWRKVQQLAPGSAWATQAGQYLTELAK